MNPDGKYWWGSLSNAELANKENVVFSCKINLSCLGKIFRIFNITKRSIEKEFNGKPISFRHEDNRTFK